MRLSQKILNKRFKKFNEEYFNNYLTEPEFKVGGSENIAGLFTANVLLENDEHGKEYAIELNKIRIYFSKRLIFNSDILDNILLHEMIHYYGYYMNEDIEGSHGKWFMTMAEKINKDGGYNIKEYYEE